MSDAQENGFQQLYDTDMTVPLLDVDGDLATVNLQASLRSAGSEWHIADDPFWNYTYQEAALHNQLMLAMLGVCAQLFLDSALVGWGELGARRFADSDGGNWQEPIIGVA